MPESSEATDAASIKIAERKEINERQGQRLVEALVSGSLYTQLDLTGLAAALLPDRLQIDCPKCDKVQAFELFEKYGVQQTNHRGWGAVARYRCRNCGESTQSYMYVWTVRDKFYKVGQVPELREKVDQTLLKALGSNGELYRKALRSRAFGFGIGALAYLRRIVEDATDTLLDLLEEDQQKNWSPEQKEEFKRARTTFQYMQKIEYAADKVLPPDTTVSGRNSFAALHDVTSNGIHGKTEEECIEIFDQANFVFTQTFRILFRHKQERNEFSAQVLALRR
jgi:hypothetical protein